MYPLVVTLYCLLSTSLFAQTPVDSSRIHAEKMNKIFQEEVIPYLESRDSTPDWATFGKHLISLYGDTGEEVLLMSQTIYSMQREDWANFSSAIIPYAKKYGNTIPAKQRHAFSQYISRNAQLLYQSGRREEGIRWQILALPLAEETEHAGMLDTIEKMKRGE
ncbi:hypothetical protein [Chitinophaga sp. CF418]|uniref:hypothetical protein n=1 Tax=Chitinophaga sp. CF418 TaxID=1855287 RepID=UPI0009161C6E|nr:hypothetical protein [Chitinophaga sp. CF418]SHN37766.1 hypothetical protein SAMN05216311_110296 [Chitinophaga sp. CF418]